MGLIKMINIDELYQHPDNPRKNLGDLTELAESIKKNGIMQNLTVMQGHYDERGSWYPDGYTLLIGHRRCAASKMAGVKYLPCSITSDLEKKEQLSIMLEENMQRNDLTVIEQANGFQLMLDLGDTEDDIANKTGFSKTTIRHRLEIAKLDKDAIDRHIDDDGEFQLSLKDLYALEKIKDVKRRDKVLRNSPDSRSLVFNAREAAREERIHENLHKFEQFFKSINIPKAPASAENEEYSGKWKVMKKWELEADVSVINVPKTWLKTDKIQYVVYWNRTIALIKPQRLEDRKLSKWEIESNERKANTKKLEQKLKAFYDKVDNATRDIIDGHIAPLQEDISLYKKVLKTMIKSNLIYYESDLCKFLLGKALYDLTAEETQEFDDRKSKMSLVELSLCYMACGIKNIDTFSYNLTFNQQSAERICYVVHLLSMYGLSLTLEEKQLLHGTHELYAGGKQDGEDE